MRPEFSNSRQEDDLGMPAAKKLEAEHTVIYSPTRHPRPRLSYGAEAGTAATQESEYHMIKFNFTISLYKIYYALCPS